jgi:hypothetical protein
MLRDLLDALGYARATLIGQSSRMQFVPARERLVLVARAAGR